MYLIEEEKNITVSVKLLLSFKFINCKCKIFFSTA